MNRTVLVIGMGMVAFATRAQPQAQIKQRELDLVRLPASSLSAAVHVPRGYAVVIGISNYRNLSAQDNLRFAEKDAENLYSVLISKEGGGFEYQNVVKLVGKEATLSQMTEKLEHWLPAQAQVDDRVVVFFVGHGVMDENRRGYLAPYDVDPKRISATGYSMERLGQVLSRKVKARWKILLTDACHSGKITVDSTLEKLNASLRDLPEGFLAMTSSRAAESSFEDPTLAGGNGVFSYFLAKGWLGEADVDPSDGVVTADELIAYVEREVRAYVRDRGSKQTPTDFGDFPNDLILGFNPARRENLAKQQLDVANGTAIFEVNLDDVEVYVDQKRVGVASPARPLRVPGLANGPHEVRGVRLGYEAVSVEIVVVPGATRNVSLRLLHQRTIKPSAKDEYERGLIVWNRSHANPQDLGKAALRFENALRAQPDFSSAALALCRVRQAEGRSQEALRSCRRAVEADADFVEARSMYGALLMESGDYPAAVGQLQLAAIQDAKNSLVQSLFAEALFLADRPEEAEAAANRALSLDTASAQGFLMRAEARRAQRRFSEASADYHECLRAQEFGSGVLRIAAFWAIGTGVRKHRSGRRALYRSQAASAHFGLCACQLGQQEYSLAVRSCNRALAIDSEDPDTHVLLAQCYAQLFSEDNRRDLLMKAKENLEAGLRINPHVARAAQLKVKLIEINELLGVVIR